MKLSIEKTVVFVCFVTSFFGIFLSNGVNVCVPGIALEFGMNNIAQNLISTIFFLACVIFTVPAGQISGKFGLKRSLIIGTSIYFLGCLVICFSPSTIFFMICRIVQGIGLAIISVSSVAMIVEAVDPKNRGKALGFNVTGIYLALSFAPVISGILIYNFGWKSIFLIVLPFLALCIYLMIFKINDEWKNFEKDPIDKIGSILYVIGMFLFMYGFTAIVTNFGKISLLMGCIFLVIFAWYELKQNAPVFNISLFKNVKFTSSNIASLLSYLALIAITTLLNYHFQYVRGFDAEITGFILIVTPVCMAIFAPVSGKLSDMINPQKLSALGMIFAAIGLGILSFLNINTPLWVIILAMILQGVGMGLFSSPNMNVIMSSVPPKYTSTASASQATMRTIGQTMSYGMVTVIFILILGNAPLSSIYATEITFGIQIICFICCILSICAVLASLVGIKSKDKFN